MTLKDRIGDLWGYAGPILLGLLVTAAGLAPWLVLAPLNATHSPEIPWAAVATFVWLLLYLAWLNGAGPPARWNAARRYRLRLWRSDSNAWSKEGIAVTLSLIGLIALLSLLWILTGAPERPPDLSAYPSTAYLISIAVMGAFISGFTEEVGFRGYMQRGLERFGSGTALLVQALVFALVHGVHGLETLLFLGPGLFIAGSLYGLLARHTGSILPGIAVHFLADLSFTFFGTLGGDWRLLIVP